MAHLSCVGETREGLAAILDRFAEVGVDNVSPCAAIRRAGEAEFAAPADGLSSAAALTRFIARLRLRDRRCLLPGGPPRGREPRSGPRLPEVEGRRRGDLPDHAAVLRQPRLFRLRRRGARDRDRGPDHPRRDPDPELRPSGPDLRSLRRLDPGRSSSRRCGRSAATRRRRRCSASPMRRAVRGAACRRCPRNPFLRAQPAPATRAVLAALRASQTVGARRGLRIGALPRPRCAQRREHGTGRRRAVKGVEMDSRGHRRRAAPRTGWAA